MNIKRKNTENEQARDLVTFSIHVQKVLTRQIRLIYIPPTKGYLRETCKSQNINPIYLTLSSPTVSFRS